MPVTVRRRVNRRRGKKKMTAIILFGPIFCAAVVLGAVSLSLFGTVSPILRMEPQGQIEKIDDRSARQVLGSDKKIWSDCSVNFRVWTNLSGWQLCVARSQLLISPGSSKHPIYLLVAMDGKQVEVPVDVDQTVVLIGDNYRTSNEGTQISVKAVSRGTDMHAESVLLYNLRAKDRAIGH
jgi:hypothetical protein